MCAEGRPELNEYRTRRVWAGRYTDAYLKRQVRPLGYTFVVWRGRHVSEPTELTTEEATGYWLEVLRVARAVQRRYDPAKLNLQILGNAVPHLHTHVVPRYLDDPEPERPPAFASAETEELNEERYVAEVEALAAAIADAGSNTTEEHRCAET
jgi:diadenosine tetraphosphate (Ap4A) HIT family hydrolase